MDFLLTYGTHKLSDLSPVLNLRYRGSGCIISSSKCPSRPSFSEAGPREGEILTDPPFYSCLTMGDYENEQNSIKGSGDPLISSTPNTMPEPGSNTQESGIPHQRQPDANNNGQPPQSPNEVNKKINKENIKNTYEGRTTYNQRRNQRMRPHERRKQNENILENLFKPKNFTKFFIIKAKNDEENLAEIDIIRANQQLTHTLKGSKPKKVSELKNGSLLVEVANEEQSNNIINLKYLNDIEIVVAKHDHLNQVKGTIYFRNTFKYSNEDLINELSEHKVTHIYQKTRKVDDATISTNVYILTFDLCTLPESVSIGWRDCDVREYMPRPRRCFKCQGFQHSSTNCRSNNSYCVNCGMESHGTVCTRPQACKNCNESHPASSTDCFYYKLAQEIIILQTRNKLSYREARKKALITMTAYPTSYARIVASPPPRREIISSSQPITMNINSQQRTAPPQSQGEIILSSQPISMNINSQQRTTHPQSQGENQTTTPLSNPSNNQHKVMSERRDYETKTTNTKRDQSSDKRSNTKPMPPLSDDEMADHPGSSSEGASERKRSNTGLTSGHDDGHLIKKLRKPPDEGKHEEHRSYSYERKTKPIPTITPNYWSRIPGPIPKDASKIASNNKAPGQDRAPATVYKPQQMKAPH